MKTTEDDQVPCEVPYTLPWGGHSSSYPSLRRSLLFIPFLEEVTPLHTLPWGGHSSSYPSLRRSLLFIPFLEEVTPFHPLPRLLSTSSIQQTKLSCPHLTPHQSRGANLSSPVARNSRIATIYCYSQPSPWHFLIKGLSGTDLRHGCKGVHTHTQTNTHTHINGLYKRLAFFMKEQAEKMSATSVHFLHIRLRAGFK